MSFLAEMLAIVVVWLSSLALGQLGVALDAHPVAKSPPERKVSRSPRGSMKSPVTVAPPSGASQTV
ncbi:hypothetical protein ACN2C6_09745 [Caulobacter sp. ErkDOM-YI]|uniref:hypothetical protein n=1 Tax=unclassified Caulobacter TaxID=2648921 RepID=UPI003AF7EFC8